MLNVLRLLLVIVATRGTLAAQDIPESRPVPDSRTGLAASPIGAAETRPAESRPVFVRRTSGAPQVLCRLERLPVWPGPMYRLEVRDDGTVVFTDQNKDPPHPIQAILTDTQLQALVEAFFEAQYFELLDCYLSEDWTDYPMVTTAITFGGRSKEVTNYHGDILGPPSLWNLEGRIDEIVGTSKWLGGQEQTMQARTRHSRLWKQGSVASVDVAAHSATVTLSDGARVPVVGDRLIASAEQGYVARLRVTSVTERACLCAVEHVDTGATLAPGLPVWTRVRRTPESRPAPR